MHKKNYIFEKGLPLEQKNKNIYGNECPLLENKIYLELPIKCLNIGIKARMEF